MKKFWIVLLSLLLSLACVMGFAACDETPPDDETGGTVQPDDPGQPHEHDFGEWGGTIPPAPFWTRRGRCWGPTTASWAIP